MDGQVGDEAFAGSTLPTWQVAGLSLAVLVGHVLNGSGALVFGLLSVGVIWTLHRLHTHAPGSRTTADLIASVPGAAPARAIRVVQFAAYVLLGAYTARNIAQLTLAWFTDPDATPSGWSLAAISVTAVAVAAVLVGALPTRLLAPVATVLAAIGLLAFFYVSLAVIAKTASAAPLFAPSMAIGADPKSIEWGPAAVLIALAITFAGFEIPTTVNDRLGSVRRPLGIAIALVAVCATTAWVASSMATDGDFRYEATDLVYIASDMFGESASLWLLAAAFALTVAAILVLVWGATRVIRPATGNSPVPLLTTAVVAGVLAFALSIGTGGAAAKLGGVAGILLLAVYAAAAHANSRLDDENSTAWALSALMATVLVVVAFVMGVSEGWWPSAIAIAIVVAAAGWALKSAAGATPGASLHTKGRQPRGKVDRQVRQHRRGEAARARVQPAEQPASNAGDEHGADHGLSRDAGVDDVP